MGFFPVFLLDAFSNIASGKNNSTVDEALSGKVIFRACDFSLELQFRLCSPREERRAVNNMLTSLRSEPEKGLLRQLDRAI